MTQTTNPDTTRQQTLLDRIEKINRFMVKIGGNRVVCPEAKLIHTDWINTLAASLVSLEKEFSITSSGAIGLAQVKNGWPKPVQDDIPTKQSYASAGQVPLTLLYSEAFAPYARPVGQLLLTKRELLEDVGFENTKATLRRNRELGMVSQINENDTVATGEIKFGDNDRLSAYAAIADEADVLIIISDVDGLYTADPRKDTSAQHIPVVTNMTLDFIAGATGARSTHSNGGMKTKLEAARIAATAGIDTIIISGDDPNCLSNLFRGTAKFTYIHHDSFRDFADDPRDLFQIAQAHETVQDNKPVTDRHDSDTTTTLPGFQPAPVVAG